MGLTSIGIIQLKARYSKSESLKSLVKMIEKSNSRIIVSPEYSMFNPTGLTPKTVALGAEDLEGEWISTLRKKAKEKSSCIITGFFEKHKEKPYNSVVVIDDSGDIAGIYRKTHLFDALGYRESKYFTPGDKLFNPIKTCGIKIGLSICFEIRFPEIIRVQVLRGAEAVIIPSAWYRGIGKEEQYEFLARARAHENGIWIIAPILYGDSFTGRSMVIDPLGVKRLDLGYGEKIIEYTVNTEEIGVARSKLPLLQLRRPELYRDLIKR